MILIMKFDHFKELQSVIIFLLSDAWLTDIEINAFLNLLKHEFPRIKGLEDPLLLTHSPDCIEKSNRFIRELICNDFNHCIALPLQIKRKSNYMTA